jgi:hypothetical protein
MIEANCGYDHAPKGADLLVQHEPAPKVDFGFDQEYVAAMQKAPALSE